MFDSVPLEAVGDCTGCPQNLLEGGAQMNRFVKLNHPLLQPWPSKGLSGEKPYFRAMLTCYPGLLQMLIVPNHVWQARESKYIAVLWAKMGMFSPLRHPQEMTEQSLINISYDQVLWEVLIRSSSRALGQGFSLPLMGALSYHKKSSSFFLVREGFDPLSKGFEHPQGLIILSDSTGKSQPTQQRG